MSNKIKSKNTACDLEPQAVFFVAKRSVLCYYELAGIYCYCSLAYKEEFL